jgi:hypothetical protein
MPPRFLHPTDASGLALGSCDCLGESQPFDGAACIEAVKLVRFHAKDVTDGFERVTFVGGVADNPVVIGIGDWVKNLAAGSMPLETRR